MRYKDIWTRGPLCTEKKQLIVAIDHGMSFPGMPGLERPIELLRTIVQIPEVDGVIATPGVYRQADNLGIDLSGLNRLITLDCVKMENDRIIQREMVITPEDAMAYRPDCFKFFFNVYADSRELMRNLKDMSRVANDARRLGVSSLAEIMFWNNTNFEAPERREQMLYEGCRMAMETGIDMLKIQVVGPAETMNRLIDSIELPTFILGGCKRDNEGEFIRSVSQMGTMHICGLMLGRNVWQSAHIADTLRAVHQSLKDA